MNNAPSAAPVIRPLRPEELPSAMQLVLTVFHQHVAPGFSPEGVREFASYATLQSARERLAGGDVFLAAELDGELAGVAEVRENNHLCLLFVHSAHRCSGVGRRLVRAAVAHCRTANPELRELTVNASPNAVAAYRRFGFRPLDEERCQHGIRHVPMALRLDASPSPES